MPSEKRKKEIRLERGTIAEVARILNSKPGEAITKDGVTKRVRTRSHVETLRLAVKVSARLKKKRDRHAKAIEAAENEANQLEN